MNIEELFKKANKEYLAFDIGNGLEMLNIEQLKQRLGKEPVIKLDFYDTLLEKFEAEVDIEKEYINERNELPEGKGIWEGIRLSRVFLKEIIRRSKISA